MKAFVLKGRGDIGFVEKPEPELKAEHGVLLRPLLVSPCTSDVHTIWQGSPKRPNLTLGHECIAEVLKIGEAVKDFKPGEVVAVSAITPDWSQPDVEENYGHAGHNFSGHSIGKSIDGAFQELFYLPYADYNLAHIPAGMSMEDALMCVDVVQTGFTAAEEANVRTGQTVVVMGIGAIGLAAILGAKKRGAKEIFAVGSSPDNVRLAESMGDEYCRVRLINYKSYTASLPEGLHPLANSTGSPVVNEVLYWTHGKGADAVLICGGNDYALPQAIDMVKYGTGVVSNVMYFGADPEMQDLQEKHERIRYYPVERGKKEENLRAREEKEYETELPHDYPAVDALWIPKFSMGRGMAGKTLKFSLSKGGRRNLERVMGEILASNMHPSDFITRRYQGLDKIEAAIYDMKNRKAIKIAVSVGERI